ncbi:MAG: DUF5615 family PIN-like protein [Planctomycetota bacterium]|nr:DUF5615 family PIN-like protein [Planctomycetota bacterium]
MRLYLDDDSADPILARFLRQAGHDVELPVEAGSRGARDAAHLTRAILQNRVLLSRNYADFRALHTLVLAAQGHHSGILIIRSDNDARDMKAYEIAKVLARLQAAKVALPDEITVLNQWR